MKKKKNYQVGDTTGWFGMKRPIEPTEPTGFFGLFVSDQKKEKFSQEYAEYERNLQKYLSEKLACYKCGKENAHTLAILGKSYSEKIESDGIIKTVHARVRHECKYCDYYSDDFNLDGDFPNDDAIRERWLWTFWD